MTIPAFFHVDPARGEPLYVQLADSIVRGVASGAIRAGDPLPPVREVAAELRINLNTVSKAYRRLQDLGVAELQRGVGVYVASGQAPEGKRARLGLLADSIRVLVREAEQLGLKEEEVLERVRRELRLRKGSRREESGVKS